MHNPSPVAAFRAILVAIPVMAVAVLPSAMSPAHLPKWWVAVVSAAIGLFATAIVWWRSGEIDLPAPAYAIAAGAFGVALVVSVTVSAQSIRGVMGDYGRWNGAAGYLAALTLGILTAVSVTSRRQRRVFATMVLLSAGAVAFYAVLQRVGIDPLPWQSIYGSKSFATMANPNFASAYLGIPVPIVIARLREERTPGARYRHIGLLLLLVLGQWATGSLLGPFAAVVGLLGMAILLLLGSDAGSRRRSGIAIAFGWGSATAVGLAGFVLGWLPAPDQVAIRLYYWTSALRMMGDHPVLGVGFGRFDDFFRRYRPADRISEFGRSALADNPHSVPLSLGSEGGILVLLPWLALVLVTVLLAVKAIRSAPSARDSSSPRWEVAGLGGAFVGYVAQASANFDVPPLAVLGFVIGGAVVAATHSGVRVRVRLPAARAVAVATTLTAAVAALWSFVPIRADLRAQEGVNLAAEGRMRAAIDALDAAATRAPWEPRYGFLAGQTAYAGGDVLGSLIRFEATARSFPDSYEPVLATARVAAELGESDVASIWYERVLRIEPNDPELREEASEYLTP